MFTEIKEVKVKKLSVKLEELLEQDNKEEMQEKYKEYEKIMTATNFEDLNINFEEAVKLLHRENKPVILEKEDDIKNPQKNYQGLQDFILIHRTDKMPTDNRLKSVAEEKIRIQYPFNGKIYEFSYERGKNSIQYVLNNEIQIGDWRECKYTIMIPFKDIPKEIIGGVSPGNTYTIGGVDLTKNCYILCKRGEAEELRRENPKLALNNIIECEGSNISGASKVLMKLLGYRVEEPNNTMDYDSWEDKESEEMMRNIMKKNGFECEGYTEKALEKENAMRAVNSRLAIYLGIRNYGLVKGLEDRDTILEQLENLVSYSEKDLAYINLMWSKLEKENIIVDSEKKKFIENIISMNENQLQDWINESSIRDEFKDMEEFIQESLNRHKAKKQTTTLKNYSIIEHVKNDVINRCVIEGIALSRKEEIEI